MKLSFELFMSKVNQILEAKTGFDSDNLPDYSYWDCWNDGMSANETAKEAIQNAKDY